MTWPMEYDAIFRALKGVITQPNGYWAAKCPAHDDRHPSLSITLGGEHKLLLKCHSGCSVEAIVKALGFKMEDLYPTKTNGGGTGGKLTFDKAYDYRDEHGELLFQAVRWRTEGGGKTFSQRHPNPNFDASRPRGEDNPEWIRGLDGVRRVLYKLPDVLSNLAKKPGRPVFVLEGEKDVETAWALGLTATCNPMGAGKWLPAYSKLLAGQNVIVIPDEDHSESKRDVGLRHAEAVCLSLYGVAESVKLMRVPAVEGRVDWDFTDWVDSVGGLTARQQTLGLIVRETNALSYWHPPLPADNAALRLLIAEMARVPAVRSPLEWIGSIRLREGRLAQCIANAEAAIGSGHDGRAELQVALQAAVTLAAAALSGSGIAGVK